MFESDLNLIINLLHSYRLFPKYIINVDYKNIFKFKLFYSNNNFNCNNNTFKIQY